MTTETNFEHAFTTTDIELSSAIYAETGRKPATFRDSATNYGTFTHQYTDAVQAIINSYSAGSLTVNARTILMARRSLFRELKALSGGRNDHP